MVFDLIFNGILFGKWAAGMYSGMKCGHKVPMMPRACQNLSVYL